MRIAVVGLGFMGSTHIRALKDVPGAQLAAVVSSDPRKLSGDLSGIQGNFGPPGEKLDFSGVKKYRDAEEAFADPGVDAVDICVPTDLHAPLAIAALRAGKHVLVEKPMALDGATADAMIAEAVRSGHTLMVGQVLRFIGAYKKAAEQIRSRALGPVRSALFRRRCAAPAWGRWVANPAASGGGAFDLLIHDVDFCVWLFGEPEAVSARGFEDMARGIDIIHADFEYRNAGVVSISGGWHHPKAYPFSMEFTIVSDGGTLDYSSEGRPPALYRGDGEKEMLDPGGSDWFVEELSYFVDRASRGLQPELCPPRDSAAAVKIARLMVASRQADGKRLACTV